MAPFRLCPRIAPKVKNRTTKQLAKPIEYLVTALL
jgi:hypothetical protein